MSDTIKGFNLPNSAQLPINTKDGLKWAQDVHNVPKNAKCVILCGHNEDAPDAVYYCLTHKNPLITSDLFRVPYYEVICGNIGTVHEGYGQGKDARAVYERYVEASKMGFGRAGNEPVSLMCNGEPLEEYAPVHYHAMNGSGGCLPDNNEVHASKADAISSLCSLFEDSISAEELEELRTDLQSTGLHYFADAAASYAEISECSEPDCNTEDMEIPLRSMVFGVMPTEAEFLSAFRAIVGTGTYAIISRGTDAEVMPSGNYDAEELFSLVSRLSDISNRDNGEETDDYAELAGACASAILSTLRFEWV